MIIPNIPYFLILNQMVGFSDDLGGFLVVFVGFSIKYNRYNPIRKLPINIYFISSTLDINIRIGTKNPPIRWYLIWRVNFYADSPSNSNTIGLSDYIYALYLLNIRIILNISYIIKSLPYNLLIHILSLLYWYCITLSIIFHNSCGSCISV